MNKLLGTLVALPLLMGFGLGSAQAAPVLSLFDQGVNHASDDDREYLIDRNLGVLGDWDNNALTPDTIAAVGSLDIGDSLRGIFNMNTLNSAAANVGGATGVNEWTGLFQAIVVDKSIVDFGAAGTIPVYVFGPDPAFAADLGGGVIAPTGFVPGAGAMFAFFEDSTNNFAADFDDPAAAALGLAAVGLGPDGIAGTADDPFDDGTTTAGPGPDGIYGNADDATPPPSWEDVSTGLVATEELFMTTAYDGGHFWTLGFTGATGAFDDGDGDGIIDPNAAAGEGWLYQGNLGAGTENILSAFGFSTGVAGGGFNAGLTRLSWNAGIADAWTILPTTLGAFGNVEFAASGNVRGVNDVNTAFEITSNFDIAFNAVPEPGTMALMGMGLLSLAAAARRRRAL